MGELTGVLPILPTIFTDTGTIDESGTRRVLEYIIAAGADGVVFPGLASECDSLTRDERLQLTGRIGDWISGRIPFVVGASAPDATDAVTYARAGAAAGASAAMILAPKTFDDDLAATAEFFRAAHAGAGIDIMLQNAPAPMGSGLQLEKVAALARAVDGIRYVKEETPPSGQRITQLTELAGPALDAVFGGAGARYVIDELARGARGTMPACEITEVHAAIFDKYRSGDEQGARDLFERTLPLLSMQAVFRWRLTKQILLKRKLIDSAFVRAPGPELDAADFIELDALLGRIRDLLPLDSVPS